MLDGMMARLALIKRNLATPEMRPHCFHNPDWHKLRKKLETSFPELPEAAKLPGNDSFEQAASSTLSALSTDYETLVEVLDVKNATLTLLKALAKETSGPFTLGLSRPLALDVMSLFVGLCQLQLLRSSIGGDARLLMSLYAHAHLSVHGSREGRFFALTTDAQKFEVPLRGLVDALKELSGLVGGMVPQLADSIAVASDLADLRRRGALNPLGATWASVDAGGGQPRACPRTLMCETRAGWRRQCG